MFNSNTLDEATTDTLSILPTLPSHLVKAHETNFREETISEYVLEMIAYKIIE